MCRGLGRLELLRTWHQPSHDLLIRIATTADERVLVLLRGGPGEFRNLFHRLPSILRKPRPLANDLPAGFALLFHYIMHRYAPWKVDYSGSALTGGALPLSVSSSRRAARSGRLRRLVAAAGASRSPQKRADLRQRSGRRGIACWDSPSAPHAAVPLSQASRDSAPTSAFVRSVQGSNPGQACCRPPPAWRALPIASPQLPTVPPVQQY